MKARLSDIAQHADVSEATVSRVLNGKPGVADATRQAVLTSLDVLGYDRPSRLRRKSAGLVGLVTPELTNPIFPAFAQVIETALARSGYTPVLCTQTPGGVHEDDYVQMLLDRSVAGIIYVSGLHANTTTDPNRYVTLRDRGLPIVLVNGYIDGVDAPFISNDDVASMDLSIGHLVQLGHTNIGLAVGPDRYVPVIRKIAGFRNAMMTMLGRDDVEDLIQRTMFTVEGGAAAASRLIDRGATAIVCGSDLMALGAIRAARQRGLEVPARPVRGGVRRLDPHRVHRPAADDGAAERPGDGGGGRARAHRRDLGQPAPRAEYVFRPELVVRGSTGAAPHAAPAHGVVPVSPRCRRAARLARAARSRHASPRTPDLYGRSGRLRPGPSLDEQPQRGHHVGDVVDPPGRGRVTVADLDRDVTGVRVQRLERALVGHVVTEVERRLRADAARARSISAEPLLAWPDGQLHHLLARA